MAVPGEIPQRLDPSTVMVATESFACQIPYGPQGMERVTDFTVIKGKTRVAAGHALVRAMPQYFEPVEQNVTYRTEEAAYPSPGMPRPRG